MNSKKQLIFFFGFISFLALLAFFPVFSTGSSVFYTTECGETVNIGSCGSCSCNDEGNNTCKDCTCNSIWNEFKCSGPNCGDDILVRHCHSYSSCSCCCGSGECCKVDCSAPEICKDCGDWEKCTRAACEIDKWGLVMPECKCTAGCIQKPPSPPRYYKNPFFPMDECDPGKTCCSLYTATPDNKDSLWEMDPKNIFLPVKLDWDDVVGWKDGWKENGTCLCVKDCAASDKRCIETNCADLTKCKVDCKTACYKQLLELPLEACKICFQNLVNNPSLPACLTCYKQILSTLVLPPDFMIGREEIKDYRPFYSACVQKCDAECAEQYKSTKAGCTKECPYPDRCHYPDEFVKSYVIRIEGDMKDCEKLKQIYQLEAKIEDEADNPAGTDWAKINNWKEEIKTIKNSGLAINSYQEVVTKSEWIPPCSCFFKPNRDYVWHVKGCCNTDGTSCGPESTWTFHATSSPELKFPYDPDWAGTGKRNLFPKKVLERLKWCEIDDETLYSEQILEGKKYYRPLSYKLFVYYKKEEGSADLCHVNFQVENKCQYKVLGKVEESFPPPEFRDKDHVFFTKLTPYAWEVATCQDEAGRYCSNFSQLWRFSAEDFTLDKPELAQPPNNTDTPVGLPLLISWISRYANSFIFKMTGGGSGEGYLGYFSVKPDIFNVTYDYPKLQLDTIYNWQVLPCWDYESKKCQEESWSDVFSFKTTGRPPQLLSPTENQTDVLIPAKFKWEAVPGAELYQVKIGNIFTFTEKPELTLDYPYLEQDKEYSWQVQTCIQTEKEVVCGEHWSNLQKFKTIKLIAPKLLNPQNNYDVLTTQDHIFTWEKVLCGNYYQFKFTYTQKAENEEKEECSQLIGNEKLRIVYDNVVHSPLECKGKYQWQVRACIDKNCQETGEWSELFSFNLVAPISKESSIVPCNRNYDDPATTWDETESCQIKHIFILIKKLIDFLLYQVTLVALVLLTLYTGVVFYLSFRNPDVLAQVKSIWKKAGAGFALLFLAWIIVSMVLKIFGYKVGIFGDWWRFNL